jgi:hypothetical protein
MIPRRHGVKKRRRSYLFFHQPGIPFPDLAILTATIIPNGRSHRQLQRKLTNSRTNIVSLNGAFDLGDIGQFSELFNGPEAASASAAAVPEPTTLSLAVVLLMGMAIRPRRRA